MKPNLVIVLLLFFYSSFAQEDSTQVKVYIRSKIYFQPDSVSLHCSCSDGRLQRLKLNKKDYFSFNVKQDLTCQLALYSNETYKGDLKFYGSEKHLIETKRKKSITDTIVLEKIIIWDEYPASFLLQCDTILPFDQLAFNSHLEILNHNPTLRFGFARNVYADTCNLKAQIDSIQALYLKKFDKERIFEDTTIQYRVLSEKELPKNWDPTYPFGVGDTINEETLNDQNIIREYYPIFYPLYFRFKVE
jgi:hypothetical protein